MEKTKNLYIIGARGFGREVACLAEDIIAAGQADFRLAGFLDDHPQALDSYPGYPPVIASAESFEPSPNDVFVCALGVVSQRRKYTEVIEKKGGIFKTLIHPTVSIRKNTSIGIGCIIEAHTIISCDVVVEDHVVIQANCAIGHDSRIRKWSQLSSYVFMGGRAEAETMTQLFTRCTILPDVRVGHGAVVGAGSLVLKNVKNDVTVFGMPSRVITQRCK